MRTLFLRAVLASAVTMLGLSRTARAWDNDGCKNSTLDGDYAFTVSGQIFLGPLTVSREGVALTHFDGKGPSLRLTSCSPAPMLRRVGPLRPIR